MSASIPQVRLYKDESLSQACIEKYKEIMSLFRDDNPKWILRHECMNLKNADNIIFVFSQFDGPAFEHLRSLKARYMKLFL